jgi:hypothetical protein
MSRAHELYKRHSMDELIDMRDDLCNDPANRNPVRGSIYLYTKKTHKKLDDIAWAITMHMQDRRTA